MPTQLQLRRGTTAQNDAFTGALGELSMDTTANVLILHDGATAGGKVTFREIPIGFIGGYGGASAPTSWLICDGSAIARTGLYAALFAAISTSFGVGNGNNTFNIPSLGDALMMGKGANNSTLGAQTHAMQSSSTKASESTSIAAHSLTTSTFATSAKDSSTSAAVTAVATHAAITPNMIFPTVVVNYIINYK